MIYLETVEVGVVGEGGLVAGIVLFEARRVGACVIAEEVHVVVERECAVEAVGLIRAVAHLGDRTAGENPANPASSQDVPLDTEHGKVRGVGVGVGVGT